MRLPLNKQQMDFEILTFPSSHFMHPDLQSHFANMGVGAILNFPPSKS